MEPSLPASLCRFRGVAESSTSRGREPLPSLENLNCWVAAGLVPRLAFENLQMPLDAHLGMANLRQQSTRRDRTAPIMRCYCGHERWPRTRISNNNSTPPSYFHVFVRVDPLWLMHHCQASST
jgi:hypothetical protein